VKSLDGRTVITSHHETIFGELDLGSHMPKIRIRSPPKSLDLLWKNKMLFNFYSANVLFQNFVFI